jgi:hypothetical protein
MILNGGGIEMEKQLITVEPRILGEIVDELYAIRNQLKKEKVYYQVNSLIQYIVKEFNLIKD